MFELPPVDLSAAIVGSTGKISLQNIGISAGGVSANPSLQGSNNLPSIMFYNESGCGLSLSFQTGGQSTPLPAGAWVPITISPGESGINWLVRSVLPGAPVSLLQLAYYAPGEPVPTVATLGNSPIGIGGSVNVSSIQTLSNEGGANATLIIDIGTINNADLWKIFNDTFSIAVEQVGIAHTVLQGKGTGNPLLIGKAGDIAEFLGQILVDQIAEFVSTLQVDGSLLLNSAQGIIQALNATSGGRTQIQNNTGGVIAQFDSGGMALGEGFINLTGANGSISALASIGVTAPAASYPHTFSFTHGFGFIPQFMIYTPGTRSGSGEGSCTVGVDNYNNTTTCSITLGAQINGVLVGGRCT